MDDSVKHVKRSVSVRTMPAVTQWVAAVAVPRARLDTTVKKVTVEYMI